MFSTLTLNHFYNIPFPTSSQNGLPQESNIREDTHTNIQRSSVPPTYGNNFVPIKQNSTSKKKKKGNIKLQYTDLTTKIKLSNNTQKPTNSNSDKKDKKEIKKKTEICRHWLETGNCP